MGGYFLAHNNTTIPYPLEIVEFDSNLIGELEHAVELMWQLWLNSLSPILVQYNLIDNNIQKSLNCTSYEIWI